MTRRDWWTGIALLVFIGVSACWFLPGHIASSVTTGVIKGAADSLDEQVDKHRRNLIAEVAKEDPDWRLHTEIRTASADINSFVAGFESYKKDVGKYPDGLEELDKSIVPNWRGPYCNVLVDPWTNLYFVSVPGKHGEFDIWSSGPDGISGTADDINSWNIAK